MATTNGIPEGQAPNVPTIGQFNLCRSVSGSPASADTVPIAQADASGFVNTKGFETVLFAVSVTAGTSATVAFAAFDEGRTELLRTASTYSASEIATYRLPIIGGNSVALTATVDDGAVAEAVFEVVCHGVQVLPIVTAVSGSVTDVTFRVAGGRISNVRY